MRVAVLGAGGQLGQAFLRALGSDAIGLGRAEADLAKPETLPGTLEAVRPDLVINCAAYNLVDKAESDPVTPLAVNSWGVRALAEACAKGNIELVHYSTNYVFGLERMRRIPYRELDLPGPLGVYGISKLAGEYQVQATCPRHYVIRTCGLFGTAKHINARRSFVDLMLHLAAQRQPIRVVNDQFCAPTRTEDLVTATLALRESRAYGLYHLTSAGQCSWYQFARTAFDLAGVHADLHGIPSEEFGAPAQRPAYSVLANDAYVKLGLTPIRPWQDALASYLRENA